MNTYSKTRYKVSKKINSSDEISQGQCRGYPSVPSRPGEDEDGKKNERDFLKEFFVFFVNESWRDCKG